MRVKKNRLSVDGGVSAARGCERGRGPTESAARRWLTGRSTWPRRAGMCGAVADPEGLLVRIMDRGPILPDSGSELWSGLFDYRDPSGLRARSATRIYQLEGQRWWSTTAPWDWATSLFGCTPRGRLFNRPILSQPCKANPFAIRRLWTKWASLLAGRLQVSHAVRGLSERLGLEACTNAAAWGPAVVASQVRARGAAGSAQSESVGVEVCALSRVGRTASLHPVWIRTQPEKSLSGGGGGSCWSRVFGVGWWLDCVCRGLEVK